MKHLLGVAAVALLAPRSHAIVTSAPSPEGGIDINQKVGADAFYMAGYTGSRAIVANIEAGHAWSGHDALGHLQTFLSHPNAGTPAGGQLGETDFHATWVASALAGRPGGTSPGERQRGIAFGAALWSGAIADSFVSGTTNFNLSNNAYFRNPYRRALISGADDTGTGPTADVVNSAWLTGSINAGNDYFSLYIDAAVKASGKTVVIPAGNRGPANGISSPASGFNSICVGALESHNSQFDQVATFSSRGSVSFQNPATGAIPGSRARVDILAPGDDLKLAYYGGSTGGNTGLSDSTGGSTDSYADFRQGTEFASAIVAGGAALVVDYAKGNYASRNAWDARVVKAVLLNSADKIAGWNNNQVPGAGGVMITTQALDLVRGAGALNLRRAFDQFRVGADRTNGTGSGGLPGAGGSVHAIGWDYANVTSSATNNYIIDQPLLGGTTLTVTLNWFVNRTAGFGDGDTNTFDASMANLDLEVWRVEGGILTALIATSKSAFSNTEHLHLVLGSDGEYAIRVKWTGYLYNRVSDPNNVDYGLAWYATAIPAPPACACFFMGLALTVRRRRT